MIFIDLGLVGRFDPYGYASNSASAAPASFRAEIARVVDRAVAFAAEVAASPKHERFARLATDALYHASSAALMTWEGATTGANGHDARRMILARMVMEHRLQA